MLAPDSLSVPPLLLAVYLMIRAFKRPRFITVITAGAFVGLSCWLRSNALVLAPFLACIIPLLFERGKRLWCSLAVIAGAVVIIAPIIIRDWIVFHQFVPLSVMAGLNLVEGIGDMTKRTGLGCRAAQAAILDDNRALQISSDGARHGDLFSYEPIDVKKNTDYVLRLSLTLEQGSADVKLVTSDPQIVLALVAASSAAKQPKRKPEDKDPNQPGSPVNRG